MGELKEKRTVSSPGERLSDIIYANKTTKKDFALALGYNPSYITQICKNIKRPSRELAQKVEKTFGVPANWLLSGAEPAPAPNESSGYTPKPISSLKDALLKKVARIDSDYELRAVLAFINSYEEIPFKSRFQRASLQAPAVTLYKVPLKGEVAGGAPITAYEERGEIIETSIPADSALCLKGRSMEPDYPSGSTLLIKENAYVTNGDVVIALIMKEAEVAEATCKVYSRWGGKVTLSPLNPEFSKQIYSKKDGYEIKIFGKVIGIV